jgi:hypothetical protein
MRRYGPEKRLRAAAIDAAFQPQRAVDLGTIDQSYLSEKKIVSLEIYRLF